MVERLVRNEKVRGSNPLTSTILIILLKGFSEKGSFTKIPPYHPYTTVPLGNEIGPSARSHQRRPVHSSSLPRSTNCRLDWVAPNLSRHRVSILYHGQAKFSYSVELSRNISSLRSLPLIPEPPSAHLRNGSKARKSRFSGHENAEGVESRMKVR